MDNYDLIAGHFQNALEAISMSVDELAKPIQQAAESITEALLQDGKLLICGNGSDAALAQLLAAKLMSQYQADRPPLPAIALSQDASNDNSDVYARQIRALGNDNDVLVCLCSCDFPNELARAIQTGRERNMRVVILSNLQRDIDTEIASKDVLLQTTCANHSNAVELHLMILNTICALIDHNLFGSHSAE